MNQLVYPLLFSILLIGCDHATHQHDEVHDEMHAHEAKLQITEYSHLMELFAEADPFAAGHNSEILAHFTWLNDFKPLESGEVTVSLVVGGKGVRQTLSAPVRPGIYKFRIQPQLAGVGQLIFDINSEKGKSQIIANNITVFDDKHDAEHAAEDAEVAPVNATSFTKEQSWKIDFAAEFPKVEPFGQVIKTTGRVLSNQGDETLITAKSNGIVVFTAENVLEGKTVSAGEPLFSISGDGLANNNTTVYFQEIKNNYEKAKADYERLAELAKEKIVAEKDLLEAKNIYDNAKANYDNLAKNFNASGQRVVSSMSGYIKQVFVQNGQYVEAGQAIFAISQNKNLILKAEVQQKYAPVLANINTANIRMIENNRTFTLEEISGKIVSIGKNANSENFLLPINIQITNTGDFVTGGFVELFLKTLTNSQAITLPNEAILEEQGAYFVFVQVHPELFEKREVKVGATDGLKTEIIKGITQQERIVTKGAILLKLAQATGTLDAHSGHVH